MTQFYNKLTVMVGFLLFTLLLISTAQSLPESITTPDTVETRIGTLDF